MSFGFNITVENKVTHLSLMGAVDENADFNRIGNISTPLLNIDLKGVKLLNSVGLRNWIRWTKDLSHIDIIELAHCPVPAVHQLSILEGFLPLKGIVTSFEVPYACEDCNHFFSYWAERNVDYAEASLETDAWNKIPTEKSCPKCKNQVEYDLIPKKYFNFLKITRR